MKLICVALFMAGSLSLHAEEWAPTKAPSNEETINGRVMEMFRHGVVPEWGYPAPQEDTFIVVHPRVASKNAPLYVVLHSAGHDVVSCVNCTKTVGNHDIYRSPDAHYALYLDCRKNKGDWWWGGMHLRDKGLTAKNSGGDPMPVERRVMDTVAWAIKHYEIDPNRVYLSGNSMGGSGTLGIGMRHGDVFAAIKANVPAGIEHVSHRMFFPPHKNAKNVKLPDPPVCIDYSGQNDGWSAGHDRFVRAMNDRKYALYLYWGPFGHANNSAKIKEVNDLIDSFPWLGVKKNEAYAAFTNATNNSKLPWPDGTKSKEAGQINAFFRWKNISDESDQIEISLFLVSEGGLKTKFNVPTEATADVTLRRVQKFILKPGASFRWSFGTASGEGKADGEGLITIAGLKITNLPTSLRIRSVAR